MIARATAFPASRLRNTLWASGYTTSVQITEFNGGSTLCPRLSENKTAPLQLESGLPSQCAVCLLQPLLSIGIKEHQRILSDPEPHLLADGACRAVVGNKYYVFAFNVHKYDVAIS